MRSRAVLSVALTAAVLIVALAFIREPAALRFIAAPLNYWLFALAATVVPVSVVLLAITSKATAARIIGVLLGVALAFPLVPMAAFAALDASHVTATHDPSHRLLSEVREPSGVFRLYQTDCGATCAYGLVLNQETEYLHLIKLVRPVWSKYRQQNGTLRISPRGNLLVLDEEHILYEHPR